MNIAVIGVGGVGGYFGGKIAALRNLRSDLNVYFIARNRHLAQINERGLLLDTDEGEIIVKPTMATDDISSIPEPDLCLICVKGYDLNNVLIQLQPKIRDKTMILPLLNGVDIYQRIRSVIENGVVFPSCVYVGTHIETPGKVTQRGGNCKIHFGKDPQNGYVDPAIFDLFKESGIAYNWTETPYVEIWSKFMFIAAFGLVTADSGKTLGEVMGSEELSGLVKSVMEEIYNIALKTGVNLPQTIIAESYAKGHIFPYELKTSFQRDYEIKDKPDERDLFGGTILRMGIQFGVKTPVTQTIYQSIERNKILP